MKNFDILWNMFSFIWGFSCIFFLLIILNLDIKTHLIISFFLAGLFTKLKIDKEDLDNKIFEIKELIEKQIKQL